MKIKCVRFQCELCSKLSSIQVFYNKAGEIKYARARHYIGQVNGKPQFVYHQQSIDYIQRKLNEMPNEENNSLSSIGHIEQASNVDPKKTAASSNLRKAGRSSSLVRTLALRAKGRRFKSGSAHLDPSPHGQVLIATPSEL